MAGGAALMAQNPGKYFLMGDDPRLPQMPAKPPLIDFFKLRFSGSSTSPVTKISRRQYCGKRRSTAR